MDQDIQIAHQPQRKIGIDFACQLRTLERHKPDAVFIQQLSDGIELMEEGQGVLRHRPPGFLKLRFPFRRQHFPQIIVEKRLQAVLNRTAAKFFAHLRRTSGPILFRPGTENELPRRFQQPRKLRMLRLTHTPVCRGLTVLIQLLDNIFTFKKGLRQLLSILAPLLESLRLLQ